jgi:hypothetical protein
VILEKIPELRRLSAEERLMLLTELWDELTALRCPNPRAGGLTGPAVAGLPERPLAKHPWEVVTARVRRLHAVIEVICFTTRASSRSKSIIPSPGLGVTADDKLLLLGQFDFDPGAAAPAVLVERIRPFEDTSGTPQEREYYVR